MGCWGSHENKRSLQTERASGSPCVLLLARPRPSLVCPLPSHPFSVGAPDVPAHTHTPLPPSSFSSCLSYIQPHSCLSCMTCSTAPKPTAAAPHIPHQRRRIPELTCSLSLSGPPRLRPQDHHTHHPRTEVAAPCPCLSAPRLQAPRPPTARRTR